MPRRSVVAHLARRFATSLWPGGPSPADEARVAGVLSPAELALWRRLSGPDRRHSVAVALRTRSDDPAVLAAALLHDVGKLEAGLGTLGRVGATMAGLAAGGPAGPRILAWAGRGGAVGRVGRYLAHDRLGADLLARAGSHPLAVAWAREHHLPPDRWSVPAALGARLKAADDD